MDSARDNKKYHRLIVIIAGIAIIGGTFLRLYSPDLDPPQTVGANSQALVTDPSNLVYFAANDAHFGESEPFAYPKWHVFKVSLISAVAYTVFGLSKVSPLTINLVGTIPPMLGIILIAAGFWISNKSRNGPWAACIICLLLSLNFTLITYNREPFLESALLFYFGLLFFLYQRFGLSKTNVIIMAAIISLACLTGKLFAIVFFGVVGAVILISDRLLSKRLKLLSLFAAGGIVSAALFLFLFFGNDTGAYVSYLSEHISNAGSVAANMPTAYRYFGRFMTFGTKSHLFSLSPFLFTATYISLLVIALQLRADFSQFRNKTAINFILFWFFGLFIFLAQSFYSPLRYQVLLLSPAAAIIAVFFTLENKQKVKSSRRRTYLISTAVFLISWFVFNQLLMETIYRAESNTAHWITISLSAVIAIAIAALFHAKSMAMRFFSRLHIVRRIVIVLVALSCVYQLYGFVHWTANGEYHLRDATKDLTEIVGPDAVFTGSFAGAVTLNSDLKYFIYFFGLEKPDKDLFKDFGVTHLALEYTESSLANDKFGADKFTTTLAQYQIRGKYYSILRVLPPTVTSHYQPTPYELANDAIDSGLYDTALVYNQEFLTAHPDSRSGHIQQYMIHENLDDSTNIEEMLENIRNRFPDDPIVQLFYQQKLNAQRDKQ